MATNSKGMLRASFRDLSRGGGGRGQNLRVMESGDGWGQAYEKGRQISHSLWALPNHEALMHKCIHVLRENFSFEKLLHAGMELKKHRNKVEIKT